MTAAQDLFVGIVAMIFGGLLLAGAAFDATALMSLAKPQFLVERLGRSAARAIVAVCGAAVIVIGAMIASGWRVAW